MPEKLNSDHSNLRDETARLLDKLADGTMTDHERVRLAVLTRDGFGGSTIPKDGRYDGREKGWDKKEE